MKKGFLLHQPRSGTPAENTRSKTSNIASPIADRQTSGPTSPLTRAEALTAEKAPQSEKSTTSSDQDFRDSNSTSPNPSESRVGSQTGESQQISKSPQVPPATADPQVASPSPTQTDHVIGVWMKPNIQDLRPVTRHPRRNEALYILSRIQDVVKFAHLKQIVRIATPRELSSSPLQTTVTNTHRYHIANTLRLPPSKILEALRRSFPKAEFLHVEYSKNRAYTFASALHKLGSDSNVWPITVRSKLSLRVVKVALAHTLRATRAKTPKCTDQLRLRVNHSRWIDLSQWNAYCDNIHHATKHIKQVFGLRNMRGSPAGFSFLYFDNEQQLTQAYKYLQENRSSALQTEPLWPPTIPTPDGVMIVTKHPHVRAIEEHRFYNTTSHILKQIVTGLNEAQLEQLRADVMKQIQKAFTDICEAAEERDQTTSPQPPSRSLSLC